MKNLYVATIVLLVLSCPTLGQRNDKPAFSVIWSENANCHPANTDEVKGLKPQCSKVEFDTVVFYIVTFDGVSYAMSSRPVRDYLVASVQISNKSGSDIQLKPSRSRLGRFQSEQDFFINTKAEFASARSQDDLRRAVYRESTLLGERDGEIRSGLQLRDRYEESRERGRRIQRTNRAEAAPPQTESPAPSVVTNSLLIPRAVFDNVLKPQTLAAGNKLAGHLVFKNSDEVQGFLVLFLNAGNVDFVFPVSLK